MSEHYKNLRAAYMEIRRKVVAKLDREHGVIVASIRRKPMLTALCLVGHKPIKGEDIYSTYLRFLKTG